MYIFKLHFGLKPLTHTTKKQIFCLYKIAASLFCDVVERKWQGGAFAPFLAWWLSEGYGNYQRVSPLMVSLPISLLILCLNERLLVLICTMCPFSKCTFHHFLADICLKKSLFSKEPVEKCSFDM